MNFKSITGSSRELGIRGSIVLLLSIGLGAATLFTNTFITLSLNPLGLDHPEEIVRAVERRPPLMNWLWLPLEVYEAMSSMHTLSDTAIEADISTWGVLDGRPLPISAEMVSGEYFSLLGGRPEQGVTFNCHEEMDCRQRVPVILSHKFWVEHYGGSHAIGSTLLLNRRPFFIIGIMPSGFVGSRLDSTPDLWIPVTAQPLISSKSLRGLHATYQFTIIARLRSGATLPQAQSEFANLYRSVMSTEGESNSNSNGVLQPITLSSYQLHDSLYHVVVLLVWGVSLLLLIVWINVSGLILIQANRRHHDLAIRIALGAPRVTLLRGLFLEFAIVGVVSGLGAVFLANFFAPFLMNALPRAIKTSHLALQPSITADIAVELISVVSTLVIGTTSFWRTLSDGPQALSVRKGLTARWRPMNRWLPRFQISVTFILLMVGALLIRTIFALTHTDLGFDSGHLISVSLAPNPTGQTTNPMPDLPEELLRRVRETSGVADASLAQVPILHNAGFKISVVPAGQTISNKSFLNASMNSVSDRFFETLGIPVISGRGFSPHDIDQAADSPLVINRALANELFWNENPLGREIGAGAPGMRAKTIGVVIGVTGDSKYRSLREAMIPTFYLPLRRDVRDVERCVMYIRTISAPRGMIEPVSGLTASYGGRMSVSGVHTMQEQLQDSIWQERLSVTLIGIFCFISLLTATAGLFAFLVHESTQRTREFGIRLALGATRIELVSILLKNISGIVGPGIAFGLISWVLMAQLMSSILFGVTAFDTLSLLGASGVVLIVSAIAASRPIGKVLMTDPALILRDE